ncbi:mitochondrial fission ELM1 family protein [Breoghania sp. L-A4]|uniref:mitochondrial fission ELM1 family protein n=1 Tax=Breoghania sp. L-A4 TaxID=2304600 RepID=UPI0020BF7574|nr:mitochondrial fission ELM1 family protein [Breoghania sp. L-A4]
MLSDGKPGDEAQCIGVAEALAVPYTIRRVAPRPLFALLMPWGPIDPRDAPSRVGSPLAPPWPDVAIASGRRAVPYLRALRRASRGACFTVFLKDPRTGAGAADFIWVPEHDALRGPNVLATPTPPHRFSAQILEECRAATPADIAALPAPRVAVLVGGDSRHHTFTPRDIESLSAKLQSLAASGAHLMITTSRRTPESLARVLREIAASGDHVLWDGTGGNPLADFLAHADAVVVTADSTNMVGEAAVTGKPVLVFEPSGGHAKIRHFLKKMSELGITRPFAGRLETYRYEPLDSTCTIAAAILERYRRKADAHA